MIHINQKQKQRESQFELLRIIAISFILIFHFLGHGTKDNFQPRFIYEIFAPVCVCGVNWFFMLSGWFKIRTSVRTVINFAITVMLFTLVNIILVYALNGSCDPYYLLRTFLFPAGSGAFYWFVQVYLMLIVTAPIINHGLENLSISGLRKTMLLFTVATVYSCNLGCNMSNAFGFSFLQGLYMYCAGYYLYREKALLNRFRTWVWTIGYLTAYILDFAIYHGTGKFVMIEHSNLLVVAESVCLFMVISRMRFQSKIINRIATAAFGCYLLQDGFLGNEVLYPWLRTSFQATQYISVRYVTYCIIIFAGLWIVSLILTPVVKRLAFLVSDTVSRLKPKGI